MVFFDLIVYLYVYEIKTRRHSKMLTAPKFKKKLSAASLKYLSAPVIRHFVILAPRYSRLAQNFS